MVFLASLERANQKAQKAVDTSDINTDTSITKFGRPKRKRKRAHVYTSESDDVKSSAEDEEPSAAYIAPPKPPALRKEAFLATTPPMPTIPTSTPQLLPIESEVMQPSMQQVTETPRGRPEAIEEKDTSGLGVKALLRLNAGKFMLFIKSFFSYSFLICYDIFTFNIIIYQKKK